MARLRVNVDGGARGNPGPAAIGVVIRQGDEVIADLSERIGEATNNVAEYRALLAGINRAAELGATEIDLVGDSELVVKQVRGEYKVKNAGIKPLHAEVLSALEPFDEWTIEHVRREENSEADALVNQALDAGGTAP
ncbi:MAG: ribonuclease HI family protein [Solirubrobacterales bacterium]|nr:ribonuclease HI family protein [Solirubrobacterales bacterium]